MADEGEEKSIIKICEIISNKLGIDAEHISYDRLDRIWFNKYDIDIAENEWIKGSPDFYIKLCYVDHLLIPRYLLVEIKLKSKEFRKTKTGGMTTGGTTIPNYGCESYYLDINPVYENMIAFSEKTGYPKKAFILAFVKDDYSKIDIISLARIEKIIQDGWSSSGKNIKVGVYGEGYGKKTYLIPKCKTIDLDSLSSEHLIKALSDFFPIPCI